MASIEFITRRIEGKRKEIEKLEKKMARIKKAEASNWENNPYWYSERDIYWTDRDLTQAREALEKYEADLKAAQEKAASRNVAVIIEFLDRWQRRVYAHYEKMHPAFLEARKELYKIDSDYCDWYNKYGFRAPKEEREARRNEKRRAEKEFGATWGWIEAYVAYDGKLDTERLLKDLKEEADRKYDFIIERTNAIVGKITDAAGLTIGAKDDLNGYIVGERGVAKVQTIGAGGYNIQCFHYRTLINKA